MRVLCCFTRHCALSLPCKRLHDIPSGILEEEDEETEEAEETEEIAEDEETEEAEDEDEDAEEIEEGAEEEDFLVTTPKRF